MLTKSNGFTVHSQTQLDHSNNKLPKGGVFLRMSTISNERNDIYQTGMLLLANSRWQKNTI